MATPTKPVPTGPISKEEKLSILSAMLGPSALASLRETQSDIPAQSPKGAVKVDADRAAWHRNRLLERLRQKRPVAQPQNKSPQDAPDPQSRAATKQATLDPQRVFGNGNASLDARLAKISDAATLGREHPAIIARLMKSLPQDERIEALRSLPGPVARSIVRRLR